jgi:maltooligosyltrehalose trehalohydrolase
MRDATCQDSRDGKTETRNMNEPLVRPVRLAAAPTRLPDLGATPCNDGVHFRVWAPRAKRIEVVVEPDGHAFPLEVVRDGYHAGVAPGLGAGTLYRYRVDGGERYPDPCSRFQPDGPHGPSLVVDPLAFTWSDAGWRGISLHGQVIYEMHVGAFTTSGTFDAAIEKLQFLKDVGITVLEVMPVNEFAGHWNWGYDGVDLFAPAHAYGDAEAFKRFVDAAHRIGLAVILDVVYNHFGPDGNYLGCYSDHYTTTRHANEWGDAIDFDGPQSRPVRDFFVANAAYWIAEFHLDGLRIDATQTIADDSALHVLGEISRAARAAAGERSIILVAENEAQDNRCIRPVEDGGFGLDAMWNDDYHHAARVALTGRREGYYTDYRGHAQEFVSAVKRGFLYQGQWYSWQKKGRGSPIGNAPGAAMVVFTQNHDQVGNSLWGERLQKMTSARRLRAITALTLLSPGTPLLFMGEEFGASSPFPFFADHHDELLPLVHEGRKEFLRQFPDYATPEAQACVPDPGDPETYGRAKLDWAECEANKQVVAFYTDLLRLRREDPVIGQQLRECIDGAVLSDKAFVIRWFDAEHGDRLLCINLGDELDFTPAPEPLLAPPQGWTWKRIWSSDDPSYGGMGILEALRESRWALPPENATLLVATPIAAA